MTTQMFDNALKTAADIDEKGFDGDAWLFAQLGASLNAASDGQSDRMLGRAHLASVEHKLRRTLCSLDPTCTAIRAELRTAEKSFAGSICVLMQAHFGVDENAASLVAAILVRKLGDPDTDHVCNIWAHRLETTEALNCPQPILSEQAAALHLA